MTMNIPGWPPHLVPPGFSGTPADPAAAFTGGLDFVKNLWSNLSGITGAAGAAAGG